MFNNDFFSHTNYREILLKELNLRTQRRPGYSLRAFARDLGIRASTLSDILKKRNGMSLKMAMMIAEKLKWSEEQTLFFGDLVSSEHARSRVEKKAALERLSKYKPNDMFSNVGVETLGLYQKWHYAVVLQYIQLKRGYWDAAQASETLNLHVEECTEALNFLIKEKIIEPDGKQFRLRKSYLRANSQQPSAVIRNFHKQILNLAIQAIDEQGISQRKSNSTVFTVRTDQIEDARADIEKFHNYFFKKYETTQTCDAIYGLTLHFFRLTKDQK